MKGAKVLTTKKLSKNKSSSRPPTPRAHQNGNPSFTSYSANASPKDSSSGVNSNSSRRIPGTLKKGTKSQSLSTVSSPLPQTPKKAPVQSSAPTSSLPSKRSSGVQTNVSQPCKTTHRTGHCEICYEACRSHCAGCKRVFYCSKQHQQQDWPKHMLVCRPFSIPTQFAPSFPVKSGGSNPNMAFDTSRPEMRFMISTKCISPGGLLFLERPLMLVANVFDVSNDHPTIWCCCCLKILQGGEGTSNGNISKGTSIKYCSQCGIPLCSDCHTKSSGSSEKKYYGGQGHLPEECALISGQTHKNPESAFSWKSPNLKSTQVGKFMKDLAILRVLLFRTTCPWRWESLTGLRNSPRYAACCKHEVCGIDNWWNSESPEEYPLAGYYTKNVCREKQSFLVEVVKLVAVFSEKYVQNPSLLMVYENLSWLTHACTSNSEQFCLHSTSRLDQVGDGLGIIVKAVNQIEEGSKITMNFLKSYEGGRSALALKLFQTTGHYCCDTTCSCYTQWSFDKTLGVRCDLIFTGQTCPGTVSPRVDCPNPEKSNLAIGVFGKAKKWECDKCKKSDKYENLHSKLMEIANDLSTACDKFCLVTSGQSSFDKINSTNFLRLQNQLLSSLSDQHWMVWKAKLRIIKSWTTLVGYGTGVLRCAIHPPCSQSRSSYIDGLVAILKQKVEIYGNGVYETKSSKTGILHLFSTRHGQFSPKRGNLLYDAVFCNFVLFMEDYKKELPLPPLGSIVKRNQIARDYSKKFTLLQTLLGQCVECLRLTEGTTLSSSTVRYLSVAKSLQEVFSKVGSLFATRPSLILTYLNKLLEVYGYKDGSLTQALLETNLYQESAEYLDDSEPVDFEVDKVNLGPTTWLSFGAAPTTSSSTVRTFASSTSNTKGAAGGGNKFPNFGIPSEDDDLRLSDDDNPFVYSRPFKKANSRFTKDQKKPKQTSSSKPNFDDDVSSYLWFSTDDDSPLEDNEFDDGFMSSSRSTFGCDLFNDKDLEELADWATLQFMMGNFVKMDV